MHKKILKAEQIQILPILKLFSKDFYLVGGTALALQMGHRYSLDFDLLTRTNIKRNAIKNILKNNNYVIQQVLYEDTIQLHCIINNVKVTFFQFPFDISPSVHFDGIIKMPDVLTLAAIKAFALAGRGKWKDYVDLYYIFKHYYTFDQVSNRAKLLFDGAYNEKLFRQQLSYYDDISYEEEVEYASTPVTVDEIKRFLTEIALTPF